MLRLQPAAHPFNPPAPKLELGAAAGAVAALLLLAQAVASAVRVRR